MQSPRSRFPEQTTRRRGISLTGYGLLVGLIGVIALSAISTSGSQVNFLFGDVADALGDVSGGSAAAPAEPAAALSFVDVDTTNGGFELLSNIAALTSGGAAQDIAVTSDPFTEYRVCNDATCSGNPGFTDSAGSVNEGQFVQLRVNAPSGCDPQTATATVAGQGFDWTVTSLPCVISEVTSSQLNGAADVRVANGHAYAVGSNSDDLVIIDIDGGGNLTQSGADDTSLNVPLGLAVDSTYAYVASYSNQRFLIFDITGPSPVQVGTLNSADFNLPRQIEVNGNTAVIASQAPGLTTVDVSNRTAPFIRTTLTDGTALSGPFRIDMVGNQVHVINSNGGSNYTIVDITNPSSPSITGTISGSGTWSGGAGVAVSGNFAYVSGQNSDSVTVVDISNPASPVIRGTVTDATLLDSVRGLDVNGTTVYAAGLSRATMTIIDASDPDNPVITGAVQAFGELGSISDVVYDGGRVYAVSFASDSVTSINVP